MLTATHLTRRFGGRVAVDDVSFAVQRGEILALLGPNGAGKTTTLRMLASLIAPTSGEVRIDGVVVSSANAGTMRGRMGFLTEAPGLWDRLSVRENLYTYARLYGLQAPEDAVSHVLRVFNLDGRAGDLAAQLSKGLRQRVALARALLHEPPIVLLDEPTSGLDPESAYEVRELMLRLRQDGRAVVMSTHNLDEVQRLADRVVVVRTQLMAIDTLAGLRATSAGRRLRVDLRGDVEPHATVLRSHGMTDVCATASGLSIGLAPAQDAADPKGPARRAPGADTPAIVRLLVENGADIDAVVVQEPSLEDVYLRLLKAERGHL